MDRTQTLDAWIAAATAGLPVSAAGKFAGEIRDHAAEARQRLIDTGMPDAEADRAALAGLGDAGAVACTFRDAHFSRRRYARGEIAMLLVFGSFIAALAISILSWQPAAGGEPHLASPWLALPYLAVNLLSAGCLLVGVKAALTLLAEQYDIHAPRWGWRAFAGCYAVASAALALSLALSWLGSGLGGIEFSGPLIMTMPWGATTDLLTGVNHLGMVGVGALMAGFSITALRPRLGTAGLTLAALLGAGAVGGAAMALLNGLLLIVSGSPDLAMLANPVTPVLAVMYLVPYIWLQVTITRLFGRMRRPGAALMA